MYENKQEECFTAVKNKWKKLHLAKLGIPTWISSKIDIKPN